MNGEELLKNMDQLDDKLIQSAADANGKGRKLIFLGAVAAVLTAITVTAAAFGMMNKNEVTLPSGTEIATEAETKSLSETTDMFNTEYKSILNIPNAVLYKGKVNSDIIGDFSRFDPEDYVQNMKNYGNSLVCGTIENLESVVLNFNDENDENGESEWILCSFDFVVDELIFGNADGSSLKVIAFCKQGGYETYMYHLFNSVDIDLIEGEMTVLNLRECGKYKKAYDEIDFQDYGDYFAVHQFSPESKYYKKMINYLSEFGEYGAVR